jgi:hypothetical protein
LNNCENQNCSIECGGGVPISGDAGLTFDANGATGNCAQLASCCMAISDSKVQQSCDAIVSTVADQNLCRDELSAFQSVHYCP